MSDITIFEKSVPMNLFDRSEQRLVEYKAKKESIETYVKENFKEGVHFGKTEDKAKKNTLLKTGAEEILNFMECSIKIYPDRETQMMIAKSDVVCYVAYIVDRKTIGLIVNMIMQLGVEAISLEKHLVSLLAWGEGRGASAMKEKTYSEKPDVPLKGSENRIIKIAEKRAIVDAVIRTMNLDFSNDGDDYDKDGNLRGDSHYKKQKPSAPRQKTPEELMRRITELLDKKKDGSPVIGEDVKMLFKKQAALKANDTVELEKIIGEIVKILNGKGGKNA